MFTDRLFGRIITIGSFVILKMSCSLIHLLLVNGTLDFNDTPTIEGDSDYRYLQGAFYIRGLINDRGAASKNIKRARKEIMQNASEYEKYLLEEWFKEFYKTVEIELEKQYFQTIKLELLEA